MTTALEIVCPCCHNYEPCNCDETCAEGQRRIALGLDPAEVPAAARDDAAEELRERARRLGVELPARSELGPLPPPEAPAPPRPWCDVDDEDDAGGET